MGRRDYDEMEQCHRRAARARDLADTPSSDKAEGRQVAAKVAEEEKTAKGHEKTLPRAAAEESVKDR